MNMSSYPSPSLTPSSTPGECTPELPFLVAAIETRGHATSLDDLEALSSAATTAEICLPANADLAYVEPLCAQDEISHTYMRAFVYLNLWDRSYAPDQSDHGSKTLAVQALSSNIPTAQASSSSSAPETWVTAKAQPSVTTSTSRATHVSLSPSSSSQTTAEHAATIKRNQKKKGQYRCYECRTLLSRKDALDRHLKESCSFSRASNVHGRASTHVSKRPSVTDSRSGSKPTAMVECMRKIFLGPPQQ